MNTLNTVMEKTAMELARKYAVLHSGKPEDHLSVSLEDAWDIHGMALSSHLNSNNFDSADDSFVYRLTCRLIELDLFAKWKAEEKSNTVEISVH
ncbi:hypothetical protein KW462_12030 [Vibrio fluvialis]|nr:hypothetical protein [Vibrio fluvialis]MBY8244746.1 hypothetical protein [Vibrio fluvialis]